MCSTVSGLPQSSQTSTCRVTKRAPALLDHHLERIGQVELPLGLAIFGHELLDGPVEPGAVMNVIDAHHRHALVEAGGFFDQLSDETVLVGHRHAEAPWVGHFFDVEDAIGVHLRDFEQIGFEDGVHRR